MAAKNNKKSTPAKAGVDLNSTISNIEFNKKIAGDLQNVKTGIDSDSVVKNLFKKLGVEELFENSKGEFFTTINMAIASEIGKKDKVKTHNKQ